MASSPKFLDRVQESSTTTGTGTYTLAGATTGFQTFAAVGDGNSCIYCATEVDGNGNPSGAWEVNIGTYTAAGTTLSRDTLRASSTGSAISWAAGTRRLFLVADAAFQTYGGLIDKALPADGTVAMEVGCLHVGTIAAYTADRTATLPATAAVGDRCGLMLTVGDTAFELLITATSGDTLNGIAGGTEWSRIFIANEVVIFRCVVANTTWIVEHDGRIPQVGVMRLSTSASAETAATNTQPTAKSGVWTADVDNASIASISTDRVTVRRAGNYALMANASSTATIAALGNYFALLTKNDTTSTILLSHVVGGGGLARPSASCVCALAASDYVLYQYQSSEGSRGLSAFAAPRLTTGFMVKEILP